MADEATLIYEQEVPIPFTVANGTGIEKGTLLKMTDPMTAIIASGAADMLAGIAAEEKIASDGKTKIGVYRKGIFKMKISGAVTVGQSVVAAGSGADENHVKMATPALSGAKILGHSLETGTTGETVLIAVDVTSATVDTT